MMRGSARRFVSAAREQFDYLLHERGLDPDMAMLLQVQHVQDIFNNM